MAKIEGHSGNPSKSKLILMKKKYEDSNIFRYYYNVLPYIQSKVLYFLAIKSVSEIFPFP